MRRPFASRRYRSGTRWCLWRWTDVVLGGRTYLTRLHLVQVPAGALMLHWFWRPDPQLDPHDHPVSFLSLVVRGGYVEERGRPGDSVVQEPRRPRRRVCWWNYLRATDIHRVLTLHRVPTITLCVAGPVVRCWGFHTPVGWVGWRNYPEVGQ